MIGGGGGGAYLSVPVCTKNGRKSSLKAALVVSRVQVICGGDN